MTRIPPLFVALLAALCACARPQLVVTVATDAPVPQLGDRLWVEVLDGQGAPACAPHCQALIAVGEEGRWPVSFGIAAEALPAGPLYLRARLYRSDHAGGDGLPTQAFVDALGQLPPVASVQDAAMTLTLNCFDLAADLTQWLTCDPATAALAPIPRLGPSNADALPRPGSFYASAEPALSADAAMVVIPGGVFVLGGVRAFPVDRLSSHPERLVRLRSFALDRDEVSVKVARMALGAELPKYNEPACAAQGTTADLQSSAPLNCVSHDLARQICEKLGKRLPTEAEWEYTAGNLAEESDYPWGPDPDLCANADVARGRLDWETSTGNGDSNSECRVTPDGRVRPFGPAQPGDSTGQTDQTRRGLRHLGGSLAEWVSDELGQYSDPCWTPMGKRFLDQPRCGQVQAIYKSFHPIRGGSWTNAGFLAHTIQRNAAAGASVGIGFRCARSL